MNRFKQLISDDSGAPSTMRVMGLVVVVPVMVVWTVLCIRQNTFIIPDTRIVMMMASAFAGKSVQSLFENFTGIHLSVPSLGAQPSQPGLSPADLSKYFDAETSTYRIPIEKVSPQPANQNGERSQTAATTAGSAGSQ